MTIDWSSKLPPSDSRGLNNASSMGGGSHTPNADPARSFRKTS